MSKQDDWDTEDRAYRLIALLRVASDEAYIEKHIASEDDWVIDGSFTEKALAKVVAQLVAEDGEA